MENFYGYLLVIVASAIFGASSVVTKYTYLTGMAPIPVLIMQNSIAVAVAWGWVLLTKSTPHIPAAVRPWMIAQGTIGGFLTSILFYNALEVLGAALATMLFFTAPAFVTFYNSVFGCQQVTLPQKLALAMAVAGIALCVDVSQIRLGGIASGAVVMALGAAIAYAFYSINGEKLLAECATPVVTAWALTFSTTMMFLVYRPVWLLTTVMSWEQATLVAAGGIMMIAPLGVYLAGLKLIGSGPASIIGTAEIPFTLILAWLFLDERLSAIQLVGGFLITMSVIILYRYRIE